MSFTKMILIIISMVLVNNYPLAQFLGICPFLGVSKDLDSAKGMGIAVTLVMGLASIVTFPIQQLLLSCGIEYMQTVVFILVIAALVQFIEMFMKKNMKSLYDALGVYLPLITTNCAVLGVALNNVSYGFNMIECIVYALGIGIGFALAILLLSYIRENVLEGNKDIPRSFQGAPIVLLTACLMSMAFFGFQGLI